MSDEGRLAAGKAPPLPKPKPADVAAARQQALSGFGTQTGAVGGVPSAGCGAGTSSGAAPTDGTTDGTTVGPTSTAPGALSGPLNGVNPAVLNMVRNSIPAGCRAQVTPSGGLASRPKTPGSAHPRGLATDTVLFCGGQQQFGNSPKMNEYIRNLNANGARGLSYYDEGFVHADLMGQDQRHWGNNQDYVRALRRGEDPGPGTANSAQGAAGSGGGDPCAGGGGGSGCQPISAATPQIAAGLSQNLGLDVASVVQGLGSALLSGNPIAAAMAAVSTAAQNVLGLGGALPLSPAALADPTAALTQAAADKIASMGANIMPSIVGNLDPALVQASGITQGLVSDKIQSTADQIFAKSSPPKLDRFISIFNAAQAAQGFANSLQYTIGNTLNNVFGNAGQLFQDYSVNNWANLPGIPNEDNPWIYPDGPDIGEVKDAITNVVLPSQFIGDPEIVLDTLVNKGKMNAFSSLFYDWDSYVTRGFGTLTNNVTELGNDFVGLGKLADLNDMLRIGTAGQIAQQIIINGGGVATGLLQFLQQNKMTVSDLSDPVYDNEVAEFMQSVIDPDAIQTVIEVLELEPTLNIETLGDLLDARWILPRSYEYNYFEKLNDISVFLSMLFVNSRGQITTLVDLGNLLLSLEVVFDSSELVKDPAVYDYRQLSDMAEQYAPIGFFTSDGTLSIADFIGTAAGYIHETTIPRIAEIHAELYNDTTYFDDYVDLVDTLSNTLSGTYTIPGIPPAANTVQPPTTAGYSFGIYNSLDDAVSDIVDAIETELTSVLAQITSDNDLGVLELITELDSLHNESSMQLAREHKLRKEYGFNLGTAKKLDQFIGDGVTLVLPLTVDIDANEDIDVYISGVWQSPSTYTVNATANTITLSSAPAFGTKIAVNYRTDAFDGIANKMQVWEFASNLESIAQETGFGRAADYLRRVVTNDVYGQRINAALMLSRNKARARAAGINSSNFETNDGIGPTYTNFVEWTGIWSENLERASQLYLEINQDLEDYRDYMLSKYQNNASAIQADVELLILNATRQLIFLQNNQIVASDLFVDLYNNNTADSLYEVDRSDLSLVFDEENLPSDGIVLGNNVEIISQIMKQEGLENSVYNVELSTETKAYLSNINVDLPFAVSLAQRVLLATVAAHLGITEQKTREIFGMQSLSKSLLTNIANDY